ncbi:MAG TPA: pilus assembly protein [Sedimenticola thiotaurini]|uniref:Pilus assembly protein n=1 Tax=Sedimenticola thiotaurini TaxID=1543721 RepID=A0A831RIC3_9GAMM|nr:pilus assembly protein [Sedimenticola thiotaurini]
MTISTNIKIKHLLGCTGLSLLVGMAGSAQAANMALADTPLFLGDSVDPNVFFELDDSGSMDWEVLTRKHWHYCAYDSNAIGVTGDWDCGWLVNNGLSRLFADDNGSFEYFEYIFETGDHAYSTGCGNTSREVLELCGAGTKAADWRLLSSSLNVMYFDPSSTYRPWVGFPDADFGAARSDPQPGSDGYNILRDLGANGGFTFHVWEDDRGWNSADDRPRRGSNQNATDTPNGMVDLWDSHTEFNVTGSTVRYRTISYAPNDGGMNPTISNWTEVTNGNPHPDYGTPAEIRANIANWYQYYRRRAYIAKAAVGKVVNERPNFRYGMGLINADTELSDWPQSLPASSVTDYSTHNAAMMDALYGFDWRARGTPLRRGLERVGNYYMSTGSSAAITDECQQNFTILFTDGYWNGSNPASAIGDSDGDGYDRTLADVADYYYQNDLRTDLANEVATNAFDDATHQHMVTYTVAFGVEGRLLDEDADGWPDHREDGSTFPVVDSSGNLLDSGRSADWGNPAAGNPEKIDDMWHAAFNSHGKFLAASTPQRLLQALNETLENISDRTGSAASVALNSGSLNNNTHLYQARFDAEDWSGQLLAYTISTTGALSSDPVWDARDKLEGQAPGDRVIVSYNPTSGSGFGFRYTVSGGSVTTGMDSDQELALMANAPYPATTTDTTEIEANRAYVAALVDYLRGDRGNEGGAGYGFRTRNYLLGDVIHSNPVYVGDPNFRYPDSWIDLLNPSADQPENADDSYRYSAFASSVTRTPMIYFGANDGMLHGINATDDDSSSSATQFSDGGAEMLAYIPSMVYRNLPELASTTYDHRYFVDGPPTVVDAFFDDSGSAGWRTVLVGGLAGGGQGVFALDVTNPDHESGGFLEGNAANLVLWEFSDQDDADMGYSYAQPAIVRLHNGEWGVVVSNGYNSTVSDGNASSSGNAVLFILDVEDGSVLKKIDTGVGMDTTDSETYNDRPNGLATPAPVDRDGDGIVDFIYAGDLYGNLWKFDVTSDSAGDWDVAQIESVKQPLFTAVSAEGDRQPITVRPDVGDAPYGQAGSMIYFGTGQYLEVTDNTPTGQATQTFYGIWDNGSHVVLTRGSGEALQKQEILLEQSQTYTNTDEDGDVISTSEFEVRAITDTTVAWKIPPATSGKMGWYMDLVVKDSGDNQGERVVANPILRNNRVLFATLIPSAERCAYGGSSWLMEVDAYSGGALPYSPFDLNQDGVFDAEDYVDMPDDSSGNPQAPVTAAGKKSKVGIIPTPGILSGGNPEQGGGAAGTVGGTDDQGNETDVNACAPGAECALTSGSSGDIEATRLNPGKGDFGRQSWQELR